MRDILSTESDGLLAQMNTTPLIDVMLVLLVMLIMMIPPQTHAIKLDLPNGPPPPVYQPKPVVNEVEITSNGALLWNGSPINMSGLESELVLTQQMYPTPEVHLRPDPEARYGIVDDVLAMIKREHVQKFGFVGNERYLQR